MATDLLEEPRTQLRLFDFRHRITVEEYHRMLDAGVCGPEPRIELLEGVIVEKMTKKPPHALATDLPDEFLQEHLPGGSGYCVSMGNPVTMEDRDSEPEPDAMVLRGKLRDYAGRRRGPADAASIAEVSHTSYNYDRYDKWVTYAASHVPVHWILDLNRRRLEVHTEPTGEGLAATYARTQAYGPDDQVPLVLDGREITRFFVKDILP